MKRAVAVALMMLNCAGARIATRDPVLRNPGWVSQFDAALENLLPQPLVDCGRHLVFGPVATQQPKFPGVECAERAVTLKEPFVVRYWGMGMEGEAVEVAYYSVDGEIKYELAFDVFGPFELRQCAKYKIERHSGLTCLGSTVIRNLRAPN